MDKWIHACDSQKTHPFWRATKPLGSKASYLTCAESAHLPLGSHPNGEKGHSLRGMTAPIVDEIGFSPVEAKGRFEMAGCVGEFGGCGSEEMGVP